MGFRGCSHDVVIAKHTQHGGKLDQKSSRCFFPGAAGQGGISDDMEGTVHQAEGPCAGSGKAGKGRNSGSQAGCGRERSASMSRCEGEWSFIDGWPSTGGKSGPRRALTWYLGTALAAPGPSTHIQESFSFVQANHISPGTQQWVPYRAPS